MRARCIKGSIQWVLVFGALAALTLPPADSDACVVFQLDPDHELVQRDGHLGILLSISVDPQLAATLELTLADEAVVHVPMTFVGGATGDRFEGFLQLSRKHEQVILRGGSIAIEMAAVISWPEGGEIEGSRAPMRSRIGGSAHQTTPFGADRLMFLVLILSLFCILAFYRRETAALDRVRLAAAGGLICVLFVCTSMAMPWSQSQDVGGERGLCMLGQEADCVAPLSIIDPSILATDVGFERASWSAAAVRAGQVTLILILLPAFIWLLVVPGSRAAQSLVVGGALPAVFLVASATTYYLSLGAGSVRRGGAPDLTLLGASAILAVAVVTVTLGRRLGDEAPDATDGGEDRQAIPTARARRG